MLSFTVHNSLTFFLGNGNKKLKLNDDDDDDDDDDSDNNDIISLQTEIDPIHHWFISNHHLTANTSKTTACLKIWCKWNWVVLTY